MIGAHDAAVASPADLVPGRASAARRQPRSAGVAGASARLDWLDAAKGIGILLVVVGHALAGMIDAGLARDTGAAPTVFAAIYVFHMPLFFLLSGLTVRERLAADSGSLLRSVGRGLAYPYFLWSIIQLAVISAAGSAVNFPARDVWWTVAELPLHPVSQFWFLHALILMQLATAFLLPRTGAVTVLLVAVALRSIVELDVLPEVLAAAFRFYLFFAIGVLIGTDGVRSGLARMRSDGALLAAGVAALALLALAVDAVVIHLQALRGGIGAGHVQSFQIADFCWSFGSAGAAMAVTALTILLAHRIRGPVQAFLIRAGQATLAIYVLHIFFLAIPRILIVRLLHVADPAVILPIVCLSGVLGPMAALVVLQRLRLAGALGLPAALRCKLPTEPAERC